MKNSSQIQLIELKQKGNGWFMYFEWNSVVDAWNGCLYNKRQKKDGIVEKVFIYKEIEDCINAAHNWKVTSQQGDERKRNV